VNTVKHRWTVKAQLEFALRSKTLVSITIVSAGLLMKPENDYETVFSDGGRRVKLVRDLDTPSLDDDGERWLSDLTRFNVQSQPPELKFAKLEWR
jgi:hypothetical protein